MLLRSKDRRQARASRSTNSTASKPPRLGAIQRNISKHGISAANTRDSAPSPLRVFLNSRHVRLLGVCGANKKPRPIAGRGCVGSDTKLLCMRYCCRTGSTPRRPHTLVLSRWGSKHRIYPVFIRSWTRLKKRTNFALATNTPFPHSAIMVETHPFTFNVVADPLREQRYRWTVCEGSQIHVRSPYSYATRREAEKEAEKAVSRRVEHWRNRE